MTTTESGSTTKTESRAGAKPARPWSSHRMRECISGLKKTNERRIVTDGGIESVRLTDKTDVIALDGTDYPDAAVERHSTVSVSVLQNALELVDTLGWETIDIITAHPNSDDLRVVALQPPSDSPLAGDQAAITVAPLTETGREKAASEDFEAEEFDGDLVTDGGEDFPWTPADDIKTKDHPFDQLADDEAEQARREMAFNHDGGPIGREFTAGQPDGGLASGSTDRRDGRLRRHHRHEDWQAGVLVGLACAALIGLLWRLLR